MNLFGITGIAGSGKSTVAGMLNKHLGNKYDMVSFADPIKDTMCLYFGVTREQLEDRVFKEGLIPGYSITCREFMEGLGECMRETFGADFWVRLTMGKYHIGPFFPDVPAEDHAKYPNWIIPDMRKPIEADAVKSYGGYIIKVINPRVKSRGLQSEKEIEQIIPDYIIYNDSSFFDLEFKVKKMVEQLESNGNIN